MRSYKLVIPGLLPGLNEYIDACRRNKYMAAKMKRQAEAAVIAAAKKQLRGVKFSYRPVAMRYTWVEKNQRRDKDNIAFAKKFVQDALVHAGVLVNDSWKYVDGFADGFAVDKKNPRVEVEIWEVEHDERSV